MPGAPAPLAAWYVETIARLMPSSLTSGASAISRMAVVQFGLARRRLPLPASALISGTMSGTFGSSRHADELSITIGPPAAESASPCSLEKSPSTHRKSTSVVRAVSTEKASMATSPKGVDTFLPAERSEPKRRSCETG